MNDQDENVASDPAATNQENQGATLGETPTTPETPASDTPSGDSQPSDSTPAEPADEENSKESGEEKSE